MLSIFYYLSEMSLYWYICYVQAKMKSSKDLIWLQSKTGVIGDHI